MSTSPCTKTQQMTPKQRAITNGNFTQLDPIIFSIFFMTEAENEEWTQENVFLL